MLKLNILKDEFPKSLLTCKTNEVQDILGGPSLIHLNGQTDETLVISTLLHGNETTGFYALQKVLKKWKDEAFKKSLVIFIGNTFAAKEKLRQLPGQVDYNRIWSQGSGDEFSMAKQVISYLGKLNLFANLDVHNNTGKNPMYACVNHLESKTLDLAKGFSKDIVYFEEPHTVQAAALMSFCPSITIEAGRSSDLEGHDRVANYIFKLLGDYPLRDDVSYNEISLYKSIARLQVDEKASVNFLDQLGSADLSFKENLDDYNFTMLNKGTSLGMTLNKQMIKIVSDSGDDLTDHFLSFESGNIVVKQLFAPSMLTQDIDIMKSDCLGYVMEQIVSIE